MNKNNWLINSYRKRYLEVFSIRINQAIKDAGISQRELSKYINVSQTEISNWIHGKRPPVSHHIYAICYALGLDNDYFKYTFDDYVSDIKRDLNSLYGNHLENDKLLKSYLASDYESLYKLRHSAIAFKKEEE